MGHDFHERAVFLLSFCLKHRLSVLHVLVQAADLNSKLRNESAQIFSL